MSEAVEVSSIPKCDIHEGKHDAKYDGATTFGPWAYMCEEAFRLYGVGLGTGRGQRLVLRPLDDRSKP